MTVELSRFDAAKYLTTKDDRDELISDAFSSGDAGYIRHALDIAARAYGMTKVERETGIKRQALYRALGDKGNPTLDTLLKVTNALGLKISIESPHEEAA